MSKVYVFMADGTEEVEALTVIDLLRRAQVEVVTVSVMEKKQVTTSHNIKVEADELLELGGRYYELYTGLKELD